MSLSAKRLAFKAALNTVTGVRAYEFKPDTPKAGDAWPQWRGMERGEEVLFTSTWAVVIFLPQDDKAAERWVEAHITDLYNALTPVAFIDGFAAANLSLTGQQFGLVISTRSE
jgi:hypothetical protein